MVKIMENPIKMDDLGGVFPLFLVQHPYQTLCTNGKSLSWDTGPNLIAHRKPPLVVGKCRPKLAGKIMAGLGII